MSKRGRQWRRDQNDRAGRRFLRKLIADHARYRLLYNIHFWHFDYQYRISPTEHATAQVQSAEDHDLFLARRARKERDNRQLCSGLCHANPRNYFPGNSFHSRSFHDKRDLYFDILACEVDGLPQWWKPMKRSIKKSK